MRTLANRILLSNFLKLMKHLFFFLVLAFSLSNTSIAQATDCKCRYPFKPECADYCVKAILQTDKFKEAMTKARLADSTRAKLQTWSQRTDNRSLQSVLTRRETAKFDAALQTHYDDPSNNQKYTSRFMHSLGATISILFGKDGLNNFSLLQTNFCYFPRINITQTDNSSFSVGVPVGIGIGLVSNTFGDGGVAFAYDLPVVFDYNFGCKSTRNADKNFGGYAGAGFGYYHVNISQSAFSDFTGTTYGPMGRAGIRFSKESWNGKGVTIGVFYKKGLEEQKLQTFGFNVLTDF